ncbi:MAG: class I SAM-dependent methyltransferase [Bacteroidales bacterium]|jgi:2-polyprenyl-3-methyl-5-hydroxy-6-metoxy-1,4-benzoquinol methylase|nr:class I SAM-dependent methyltransferase [Bacteroidales bacterium]
MLESGSVEIQERVCPVCGSKQYTLIAPEKIDRNLISQLSYSSRKIPEFMHLKLVLCSVCGLIYTPEPTSLEELKRLYTDSSFETSNEELCAAKTYFKLIKPYLKKINKSDTVLDVGAGSGSFLYLFRNFGFCNLVGIEPSIQSINDAHPDVINHIRQGIFNASIVKDIKPSIILSCMTLEHMYDPKEFLTESHKIIASDGLLFLVAHNHRAVINRILGLKSPIIDLEHMQIFSKKSLKFLLKTTGYSNINIFSYFNTYPLRYWIKLLPLPLKLRASINNLIKSNFIGKIPLTFPLGNIVAIATPVK